MAKVEKKPIVLLTDFGQQDAFAGVLKGVIASISPETKVMDLSHGIHPQNILQGSFLLVTSCSYFPKGSVFCVIVDPGVGSDRKGICIQTRDYFFVGPDNGVIWKAAKNNTIKSIVHLTNKAYFLESISNTFHGRDIFAPVAAHISKGIEDISILGKPLEKCIEYDLPQVKRNALSLELTVIHIDGFGNVTLNLEGKEFEQVVQHRQFCLTINGVQVKKVYSSYSQARDKEFFLINGSSSYMEISLKNSNAAKMLDTSCLSRAVLELTDSQPVYAKK